MKAALAGVGAALAASACCIGPLVLTLLRAGALSAASAKLVPYRPRLIGVTVCLVGVAFYRAYRPAAECSPDATCSPRLDGQTQTIGADEILLATGNTPNTEHHGLEHMARLGACSCRPVSFEDVPEARILKRTEGLIKTAIHPETTQTMGVHILAPHAATSWSRRCRSPSS